MRVAIIGDTSTARGLRSLLLVNGFQLDGTPRVTITLEDGPSVCPVVDGIDSELERVVVSLIAELTPSGHVLLARRGGVQHARALKVTVPKGNADEMRAVELGLFRGLIAVSGREQQTTWRQRVGRWIAGDL